MQQAQAALVLPLATIHRQLCVLAGKSQGTKPRADATVYATSVVESLLHMLLTHAVRLAMDAANSRYRRPNRPEDRMGGGYVQLALRRAPVVSELFSNWKPLRDLSEHFLD